MFKVGDKVQLNKAQYDPTGETAKVWYGSKVTKIRDRLSTKDVRTYQRITILSANGQHSVEVDTDTIQLMRTIKMNTRRLYE